MPTKPFVRASVKPAYPKTSLSSSKMAGISREDTIDGQCEQSSQADDSPAWRDNLLLSGVSATIIGLILALAFRNKPFRDPNLVVFVRLVASLAVAVLGAALPGLIHVSWKRRGVAIRAAGAFALFLLTFFFTPRVLARAAASDDLLSPPVVRMTLDSQRNSDSKTADGWTFAYEGYDDKTVTTWHHVIPSTRNDSKVFFRVTAHSGPSYGISVTSIPGPGDEMTLEIQQVKANEKLAATVECLILNSN